MNLFVKADKSSGEVHFLDKQTVSTLLIGTHCLGSGELVYEKHLELFVMKCNYGYTGTCRLLKSRIQLTT